MAAYGRVLQQSSQGLDLERAIKTLNDGQDTLQGTIDDVAEASNTSFLLISAYLVFFMQCGFAMLSVGSVRKKNAMNIVLKNLLDACVGALAWYLTGFAFAFGDSSNAFFGHENFALDDFPVQYNPPKSELGLGSRGYKEATWLFQYAFTATAATIVSGAVAERCKFEAYLGYAMLLSGWVYPVVVHWLWSPTGWASAWNPDEPLFGSGAYDFAGCGVVHMVGGSAALCGAWILGPRLGRFNSKGEPQDMPGHNASLALLGVFILWFGWYGFNPGSALYVTAGGFEVAAHCAVTTTLAAAGGCISCMFTAMAYEYIKTKHVMWDLITTSNGALAGLVGITASCATVHTGTSIAIGLVAGVVYFFASKLVVNVLKVDDPLDAVAVHLFCGAFGLLCAGLLPTEEYVQLAYGHEFKRGKAFGAAIVMVGVIFVWVAIHMVPFFFVAKRLGLFRVSPEDEHEGLDVSHHGGSAYPTDTAAKMEGGGKGYATLEELATLKRQIRDLESKMGTVA